MIKPVSACCGTHYTEEPTEISDRECIFVCWNCKNPCKLKMPEAEGVPRSEEESYKDGMSDPLTAADPPVELREEKGEQPVQGVQVKDGLIYQDGKVIGKSLSDKEWFKGEFNEEWQGTDEALKQLRNR